MNQDSSLLSGYRAQEAALSLEIAIAREVTMDVYHRLSSLADQVEPILSLLICTGIVACISVVYRRARSDKALHERQCSSKGLNADGYDITSADEKSI